MNAEIALLITLSLLLCHFLGDYCLTNPKMLAAKKHGEPIWPIAEHAWIHAGLMVIPLVGFSLFGAIEGGKLVWIAVALQFFTHWLIDICKGKTAKYWPNTMGNIAKPQFWWIFGLDQLAHQIVILIMVWILV